MSSQSLNLEIEPILYEDKLGQIQFDHIGSRNQNFHTLFEFLKIVLPEFKYNKFNLSNSESCVSQLSDGSMIIKNSVNPIFSSHSNSGQCSELALQTYKLIKKNFPNLYPKVVQGSLQDSFNEIFQSHVYVFVFESEFTDQKISDITSKNEFVFVDPSLCLSGLTKNSDFKTLFFESEISYFSNSLGNEYKIEKSIDLMNERCIFSFKSVVPIFRFRSHIFALGSHKGVFYLFHKNIDNDYSSFSGIPLREVDPTRLFSDQEIITSEFREFITKLKSKPIDMSRINELYI